MAEPVHWQIKIMRQPERILSRLPHDLLKRLDRKIQSLTNDPRPEGCIKLEGYDKLYRVRVGDWRISYAIEEDQLIVLILEVAPRGGAYRNL
jgi:mRNA interferase RelE/StbE